MKQQLKVILTSTLCVFAIVLIIYIIGKSMSSKTATGGNSAEKNSSGTVEEVTTVTDSFLLGEDIKQQLLTVNPYSRSGQKLNKVNAIVIHYVGNPGTTAAQNRNYFEGLKDSKTVSASSHYIVGLEGEIIQCVPLEEISYASNNRNSDTIAIECCHPDATGKFNKKTYNSLVKLTAALLKTYGLSVEEGLIRHYDVTGKECPLYFVRNEDEWYGFKLAVDSELKNKK